MNAEKTKNMRFALFWDFTQRRMAGPYRRCGTTYRSHLQGSRTAWPYRRDVGTTLPF